MTQWTELRRRGRMLLGTCKLASFYELKHPWNSTVSREILSPDYGLDYIGENWDYSP